MCGKVFCNSKGVPEEVQENPAAGRKQDAQQDPAQVMAFEKDGDKQARLCKPKRKNDRKMKAKQCSPGILKPEYSDANRQIWQYRCKPLRKSV